MKHLLKVAIFAVLTLFILLCPLNSAQASVKWLPMDKVGDFEWVTEPRALKFPQDFGPHNDYQTEWWYYTGVLETLSGKTLGYQLTFFRRALTPQLELDPNASEWRTNQIYSAHFTISDIAKQKFYPHERLSRGAMGLAGVQSEPYHVWLDNWSVSAMEPGVIRLKANAGDVALDLVLHQKLPPILHGDQGYFKKGVEPWNASYYYSMVQQQTQGTVRVDNQTYEVAGLSWNDHEYSTLPLEAKPVHWDWFSLQMNDGSALMIYALRNEDGSIADFASGTYISADGHTEIIDHSDWQIDILSTWRSPASKALYPSKWHIEIPKFDIVLDGKPLLPNQELEVLTTYWEGAVAFDGSALGHPVSAKGYVEMTGYAA